MRKHAPKATKASAIALIAAASMCLVFASTAGAQPLLTHSTTKFQKAQQALEHQIIARQVQLTLLGTEVANASNVTVSDRASLVTIISGEQTSLATDATNAAAATTYTALNMVRQAVIGDERVYAVVTAQVKLVIAADNDTVVEAGYTGISAELAPFVTELDSTHASKLLSNIGSQVTAATALTANVSIEALALTPAGYPGNESQITTYTFQLKQVAKDLATAKADVKGIEAIALGTKVLHVLKHA